MRITRGAGGIGTDYFLVALANGQAFAQSQIIVPATGLFAELELFNPVGSGVVVRVRWIAVAPTTAARVALRQNATDLLFASVFGKNLKLGGAASVAKFEQGSPAALSGASFLSFDVVALSALVLTPGWVCEMPAGQGLVIDCETAGVGLDCSIAWIEV